jgi:hypothetical protein
MTTLTACRKCKRMVALYSGDYRECVQPHICDACWRTGERRWSWLTVIVCALLIAGMIYATHVVCERAPVVAQEVAR